MGKFYVREETWFIAKLFKDTNVNIAFTSDNTIGKRLTLKQEAPQCKYDRSRIYQLTHPNCKLNIQDR